MVAAETEILSESSDVGRRRDAAEKPHRATLTMAEDFDDEKRELARLQLATMNILEDFNEERTRLGQTQGALVNILEDVEAERAKAEQARTLLEAVNKELEAFSYSVSHDLRAPLRAIGGFAQALIEDCAPQLDDTGERDLRLIQANTEKMGRLIDDLLTFSRLGRQQLVHGQIDMEHLGGTVFAELAAQASGRQIRFVLGRVPPARGDQAMIRQVLANLLGNAIKFTRTRPEATI